MIDVNILTGTVHADGEKIKLTMREYQVLLWFYTHPGCFFNTDELILNLYSGCGSYSAVYQFISRINAKFGRKVIVRRHKRYGLKTGNRNEHLG